MSTGESQGSLRRSLFFVPGGERRKLDRARTAGADTLLLDLEDSVALPEKDRAREQVAVANEVYTPASAEIDYARRVLAAFRDVEVGGLLVNEVPTFRLDAMPYGGTKGSGTGREGPRYAIEEMTEPRHLVLPGTGA